jgi:hypothetical protein
MWIWLAQRGASPLHVHRREEEQFLVIDEQARFMGLARTGRRDRPRL